MFTETKSPLTSRGVLGGASAVLLGASQVFGWAMTPADAADLSQAMTGLAVSISGIVAVIGRVRASTRISI